MSSGPNSFKNASEKLVKLEATLALCSGLLPVWGRHLATSRAQSAAAVAQMLSAFSDIGPHIKLAERQFQNVDDVLSQPMIGFVGIVEACEVTLAPLLQDSSLSSSSLEAVHSVLAMVRTTVEALEQISKSFQHKTQTLAQQVDRMYVGLQYQDRVSQMMSLLERDIADLHDVLSEPSGPIPSLAVWMEKLALQYAMAEQRDDHTGLQSSEAPTDGNSETTFF